LATATPTPRATDVGAEAATAVAGRAKSREPAMAGSRASAAATATVSGFFSSGVLHPNLARYGFNAHQLFGLVVHKNQSVALQAP
jgi:hypothetical protein